MKLIGRAIAALSGAFLVATIAGAIALAATRRHVVAVDEPDENEVHLTAILGPLGFASTAPAFRGGTIDAWYGGGIVDLRGATLDPAGATLRVRAIFGGAQVAVPASWNVVSAVRGLGGVGDARARMERPVDAPTLRIEGFVLFGGFGVTSDVPDGAMEGLQTAMAAQASRWSKQPPEPAPAVG